jgi:hypothetical protein
MRIHTIAVVALLALTACEPDTSNSDTVQRRQNERILAEGTSAVGMPAIKNFRERRILKDVLELRDQDGLVTYTYLFSEQRGCLIKLGSTIGYPIPYATQFTNPEKIADSYQSGYAILPQADPNGLFSPAAAEGSWVIMKNPNGPGTAVVYAEPRLVSLPFEADAASVCHG